MLEKKTQKTYKQIILPSGRKRFSVALVWLSSKSVLINEPHSVVQTVAEETSHAVTESSYKHNLQEAPKHVYIQ